MQQDLGPVVELAYRAFLGRDPESDSIVRSHFGAGSPEAVLTSIAASPEAIARSGVQSSPFLHYYSMFDAPRLIEKYAVQGIAPEPHVFRNFMGVRIEEDYLPHILNGLAGTVEPVPLPSNWHADLAEWAAVLRAVDLADTTFTLAELGCGWGCWLNNAGVAARNRGLDVKLIGVEGDEGHIEFARRSTALNEFRPDQLRILRGIAAARSGVALFPRQAQSGLDWGLEPVFGASEAERAAAVARQSHDELAMIPLDEVIGENDVLDLLHIDIQGGEAALIEDSLDILSERVAYMFVGTHSRVIEGRIIDALPTDTWRLEIERPAIVRLLETGPEVVCDGDYGWRNMRLRPD